MIMLLRRISGLAAQTRGGLPSEDIELSPLADRTLAKINTNKGKIALDPQKPHGGPSGISETLRHELAHLLEAPVEGLSSDERELLADTGRRREISPEHHVLKRIGGDMAPAIERLRERTPNFENVLDFIRAMVPTETSVFLGEEGEEDMPRGRGQQPGSGNPQSTDRILSSNAIRKLAGVPEAIEQGNLGENAISALAERNQKGTLELEELKRILSGQQMLDISQPRR